MQPFYDKRGRSWSIFTARETYTEQAPRVVLFNRQGQRVWADVDQGHMHMGWVAHLPGESEPIAVAVRTGGRSYGPFGYITEDFTEFAYRALSGEHIELPFETRSTAPVDLDGDGYHEFVRTFQCGPKDVEGEVLNSKGQVIGNVGSAVAMASKFTSHPGEQMLGFRKEGSIVIWGDRNAEDSTAALERYSHPFYRANQRTTGHSPLCLAAVAGV